MKIEATKLRDTFDSLLKTEYINQKDIKELNKFYIDKFQYLLNTLGKKNNFIVGRRGTGKTTLLYRAYLECMLSFSKKYESGYLSDKHNNLGIYIDLNKISTFKNDTDVNFERDFLLDLVREFRKQVDIFWKPTILETIKQTKNEIDNIFKEIERLIVNGEIRDIVDIVSVDKKNLSGSKKTATIKMSANPEISIGNDEFDEEQISSSYTVKSIDLTVSLFYEKLFDIKKKANISNIFIFLDEYSALNETKQIRLSKLLKKLFDSKVDTYYKIGVIADNYNFGELRLERDLHKISLDIDSIIAASNSINDGLAHLLEFTKEILASRLKYIVNDSIDLNDIFVKKDLHEILLELARASMGVTRTLGKILGASLQKALNSKSDYITLSQIKEGIRETSKNYQEVFNGMVKKCVVEKEVQDLLYSIIERAQKEQQKNTEKQSSFFSWLPEKETYLAKLEENYLIHKILTNQRLKDQKIDVDIFALDYGICLENKLNYYTAATEKRQDRDFVQTRFFYDEIATNYDSFFNTEGVYKCTKCGTDISYTKNDITLKNGKILTRCPEHPDEELHYTACSHYSNTRYSEEEQKIIGFLATISKEGALLANEIQKETGANRQKIAWFSKNLEKENGAIKRIHDPVLNKFRYYGSF